MASPPKPKPRKRLNIAKETPCGRKQGISKSSSPGQEQGKDSSSANSDIRSSPVGKINERLRNQNNDSGSAELTTKQLFLKPEAENENNEPKTNSTENTERNFLSKDCGIDSAPAIPPKLFILRSKKELGNDFGNDDHTDDEDTQAAQNYHPSHCFCSLILEKNTTQPMEAQQIIHLLHLYHQGIPSRRKKWIPVKTKSHISVWTRALWLTK